jgi:hypothetical protein
VTQGGFGAAPPEPQRLRPLGVGESLDVAINLYRRNAVAAWKIVACIIVPVAAINQVITALTLPSEAFVHNGLLYTPTGQLSTPAGAVIASIVLSVVAIFLASAALAISFVDAYVEQPLDWVASIRAAATRLVSLVWLAALLIVLIGLGLIALILPGVFLLVVWSVSIPALMFEHLRGFKALGRSFDLVRGRWWATFARLLVAIIMVAVVTFVIELLVSELAKGLKIGTVGLWFGFNWLSGVLSALISYPFLAAVIAVIYIDLRIRKEALDIELLASGFAGPGSAPAAEPPISSSLDGPVAEPEPPSTFPPSTAG